MALPKSVTGRWGNMANVISYLLFNYPEDSDVSDNGTFKSEDYDVGPHIYKPSINPHIAEN